MLRRVGYIFVILDRVVKGDVIGVDTETCTICSNTDLDANAMDTILESLLEHV
jgi:hypothetical protein